MYAHCVCACGGPEVNVSVVLNRSPPYLLKPSLTDSGAHSPVWLASPRGPPSWGSSELGRRHHVDVPGFCAQELGIAPQVLMTVHQALCHLSQCPSPFPAFLSRSGINITVAPVKTLHPAVRLPRFESRLYHFSAGSLEHFRAFELLSSSENRENKSPSTESDYNK